MLCCINLLCSDLVLHDAVELVARVAHGRGGPRELVHALAVRLAQRLKHGLTLCLATCVPAPRTTEATGRGDQRLDRMSCMAMWGALHRANFLTGRGG